jgi:hypothetical protein
MSEIRFADVEPFGFAQGRFLANVPKAAATSARPACHAEVA